MKGYISHIWLLAAALFVGCSASDIADSNATNENLNDIINVGGTELSFSLPTGEDNRIPVRYKEYSITKPNSTFYNAFLWQDDDKAYHMTDTDNKPSRWLNNGQHEFQAIYWPEALLTAFNDKSFNTTDQNDDNYTLLSEFLAIQPNFRISSTVEKITLPFAHRLARIIAHINIDPLLGEDVKLQNISFKNVDVLTGLTTGTNFTYSPVWDKIDELKPHTLKADSVFDIIVRPTYSVAANVMYDEKEVTPSTSSCEIKVQLSSGLKYKKTVSYALNANQELNVYLNINAEGVDFNKSVSEKWDDKTYHDKYYELDTPNHTLAESGSSWQRALTYPTDSEWTKHLFQAIEGGAHHGDYFILDKDITIDYTTLSDEQKKLIEKKSFFFTGHLDGFDHTITLMNFPEGRTSLFDGINDNYTTIQEKKITLSEDRKSYTGSYNKAWQANVHLEKDQKGIYHWVPEMGYRAEVININLSFCPLKLLNF